MLQPLILTPCPLYPCRESEDGNREGGGGLLSFFNIPEATVLDSDDDDEPVNDSGVFMYGAVIMMLHKNVVIDPIMSQGYRLISDKVWRIDKVAGKRTILGITDTKVRQLSELA